MRGKIKSLIRNWAIAALQPRPLIGLLYLPRYFSHWIKYDRESKAKKIMLLNSHPCLGDWCPNTPFDAHYFYQGAWLSRKLAQSKPSLHVDIGSSVLTISVISAVVNTIFVDYRPLRASLSGLELMAGDIKRLPFRDNSIASLSCLHVIEHIGLGRYGDAIDPDGSVKAADELERILCVGGKLYVSVPIGDERVCFNAHRVHDPESVIRMFSELKLIEFSYIDDRGQMQEKQRVARADNLHYGCGLFEFEKV
jgi:hypothetical protein